MMETNKADAAPAVDETANQVMADGTALELEQVERTLHELFRVSTRIARLLDLRHIAGDWTKEQHEEVYQLLAEEDRLREQLREAGGPSWDSSRRWVE